LFAEAAPMRSPGRSCRIAHQNDGIHRLPRIISSTSIAIRLRNIMLVGLREDLAQRSDGKRQQPPAANTPRLTASRSSGKCRWQLLKAAGVSQSPDNRLVDRRVRVSHRLGERPAQKSAEIRVAVVG